MRRRSNYANRKAMLADSAQGSISLLLVIGGVGSLDWCGIALRHL